MRDHIYFFDDGVQNASGIQNSSDAENSSDIQNASTTKLVPMDYYIENEITNVKKLKHISCYEHFFYLFESVEKMQIGKMDENIYHLKQVHAIKDDYNVLFRFKDKQLLYMENYLQSLQTPRKYIYTLIEFYKHINRAITRLLDSKLVCNHININSIVVDTMGIPLLCNFKFSIDITRNNMIEHLHHLFIEYDPTYLPWCPELHILSFLLTNKLESLSLFNIENILRDCIEYNYLLHNFGNQVVNDFKKKGLAYFKKYMNMPVEFIIRDILEHWRTWDNYAFSILYLQLLIGIHKKIKKNNKFIIVFMKLLVKNISSDPRERLSLENTFSQFESILYSDKDTYIDLLNAL